MERDSKPSCAAITSSSRMRWYSLHNPAALFVLNPPALTIYAVRGSGEIYLECFDGPWMGFGDGWSMLGSCATFQREFLETPFRYLLSHDCLLCPAPPILWVSLPGIKIQESSWLTISGIWNWIHPSVISFVNHGRGTGHSFRPHICA